MSFKFATVLALDEKTTPCQLAEPNQRRSPSISANDKQFICRCHTRALFCGPRHFP